MSVLVHSFAVFDTCLARLYVRETDLLFALAARILPGPASREDLHEFVRLRLMAEKKAPGAWPRTWPWPPSWTWWPTA